MKNVRLWMHVDVLVLLDRAESLSSSPRKSREGRTTFCIRWNLEAIRPNDNDSLWSCNLVFNCDDALPHNCTGYGISKGLQYVNDIGGNSRSSELALFDGPHTSFS